MKSIADLIRRAIRRATTHPASYEGTLCAQFGGEGYTRVDARRRLQLLDRAVRPDGGWRTIRGVHVHIGEDGKIDRGPAALRGKTHNEAHDHVKQNGHDHNDPHVLAEKAQHARAAGKRPHEIGMTEQKAHRVLGHDHPLAARAADHSPHATTDDLKAAEKTWRRQASKMPTPKLKRSLQNHDTRVSNPDHPVAQLGIDVMRREPETRGVKVNDRRGKADEPAPSRSPAAAEPAAVQPKPQYIAGHTREESLNRYREARRRGEDVERPKHGSELGYLGDDKQKAFEHWLDSEYEAKHGVIDENDLDHEKASEKGVKVVRKSSIESRLLDEHERVGGDYGDTVVDGDGAGTADAKYHSNDVKAAVGNLSARTFKDKLPTEVTDYLKGRTHLTRLFRVAKEGQAAHGPDAFGDHGDAYLDAVDRLGQGRLTKAVVSAKSSPDPEVRFLGHVMDRRQSLERDAARRTKAARKQAKRSAKLAMHDRNDKRRRGEAGGALETWDGVKGTVERATPQRTPSLLHFPVERLETGHSFTIGGEHFHVDEPDEGQKVLLGPAHYPELPLDAVTHLPIDKGSLMRRRAVAAASRQDDADIPFSRTVARARLLALANANHDERGRFAHGPIRIAGNELGDGLDDNGLRAAADAHLRRLQGVPFKNRHTGRNITISGRGRNKIVNSTADNRRAKLVPFIPQLIEHGTLKRSEKPTHAGRVGTMHRFEAGVNFEGRHHRVNFLVHEDANGDWYYNHAFGRVRMKKARPGISGPAPKGEDTGRQGGPSNKNIGLARTEVNQIPRPYASRRSATGSNEKVRHRLTLLSFAINAIRPHVPPAGS